MVVVGMVMVMVMMAVMIIIVVVVVVVIGMTKTSSTILTSVDTGQLEQHRLSFFLIPK